MKEIKMTKKPLSHSELEAEIMAELSKFPEFSGIQGLRILSIRQNSPARTWKVTHTHSSTDLSSMENLEEIIGRLADRYDLAD
jgi:hypothetical protein